MCKIKDMSDNGEKNVKNPENGPDGCGICTII